MAGFEDALRRYYDDRANVYDDMYRRRDSRWRHGLATLASAMASTLQGCNVLEVACGTGFWTEIAAKAANRVVAVDVSEQMLAIARRRKPSSANVEYVQGDAYALAKIRGEFNAGLANFWFSHVPKARMDEFLSGFHHKLGRRAVVFMADNVYVPGIGGQLVAKAGVEDDFKLRQGSNGPMHEVLKNYYTHEALMRLLSPRVSDLSVNESEYFWWVTYSVP